jgi:hypothetical protein
MPCIVEKEPISAHLQVYRIKPDGDFVRGIGLDAFIHNGAYYHTILKVYADGMIDCWGLVTYEEFLKKVEEDWVTAQVPNASAASRVKVGDLFYAYGEYCMCSMTDEDLIKEVDHVLGLLQGRETASNLCYKAFAKYIRNPSPDLLEEVRQNYDKVAATSRRFILGDQDLKDGPIKHVLAGRDTKELRLEWCTYYPERN